MSDQEIHDLIQTAYEAALSRDWDSFLEKYVRAFDADGAWLPHSMGPNALVVDHYTGFDEATMRHFHESFAHLGCQDYFDALVHSPVARVNHFDAVVPAEQVHKGAFYNEFVAPLGFHSDGNFAITRADEFGIAGIAVHYRTDRDRNKIPNTHARQQLVVPHLRAAQQLERKITRADDLAADYLAALELEGTAVLSCSGAGQVIAMTHPAERLLAKNDGLGAKNGHLLAQSWQAHSELMGAICRVAACAKRESFGTPEVVLVPRLSGRAPLRLVVFPRPASDRFAASGGRVGTLGCGSDVSEKIALRRMDSSSHHASKLPPQSESNANSNEVGGRTARVSPRSSTFAFARPWFCIPRYWTTRRGLHKPCSKPWT